MINDFCNFVKQCADRPNEEVNMTVREYLLLRQHVVICSDCQDVIEKMPIFGADDSEDTFGPEQSLN